MIINAFVDLFVHVRMIPTVLKPSKRKFVVTVNVITLQVASIYLARLIPIVQPDRVVVARVVHLAQVVSVISARLFQIALLERVAVTVNAKTAPAALVLLAQ